MIALEEFNKCKNDFFYFVKTYVKVHHPLKGLITFEVHDYLRELFHTFENQKYVVVKKFRQGGFTTFEAIYGLWKCLFYENEDFLYLTAADRWACGISGIVKSIISHLPPQFQALLTSSSDHVKKFAFTNSSMNFYSIQASIGKDFKTLCLDEAAHIAGMESHWQSFIPNLSSCEKKCFIVSTLNKKNDWFNNVFEAGLTGKNCFCAVHFPYHVHPEYCDPKWADKMIQNLGEKNFLKEFEGIFPNENGIKIKTSSNDLLDFTDKENKITTKKEKKELLFKLLNELIGD